MATLLNYFDDVEGNLCLRINRYSRSRAVRKLFAAVSKLGDGWYWAMLGGGCLLADFQAAWPFVLRAACTAAVGVLVYRLLKEKLVRERPYVSHAGIVCGTAPLDRYSFPSGHTLHAVSFTVLFTAFEPALFFLAAPFALLVALSRMVLGLHYPSDVLVGAAIGGTLAAASNLL